MRSGSSPRRHRARAAPGLAQCLAPRHGRQQPAVDAIEIDGRERRARRVRRAAGAPPTERRQSGDQRRRPSGGDRAGRAAAARARSSAAGAQRRRRDHGAGERRATATGDTMRKRVRVAQRALQPQRRGDQPAGRVRPAGTSPGSAAARSSGCVLDRPAVAGHAAGRATGRGRARPTASHQRRWKRLEHGAGGARRARAPDRGRASAPTARRPSSPSQSAAVS